VAEGIRPLERLDPVKRARRRQGPAVGTSGRAAVAFGGVVFAILGLWLLAGAFGPMTSWQQADGTVIAVSDSEGLDQPDVKFLGSSGKAVTFTDPESDILHHYVVGQSVRVAYDPRAPGHARVYSVGRLLFMPTVCLLVGVVLIVLALHPRVRLRRDWF
jgi:hypothetical protein